MKPSVHIALLGALFFLTQILFSAPAIDNTCQTCPRRQLDSLNVAAVRHVRVNQAGYRPQDKKKFAFVANPASPSFTVYNANTNTQILTGELTALGNAPAGKIWVNGAFNSITSIYQFGNADTTTIVQENLYRADFSAIATIGQYYVLCGTDTSARFWIHDEIYNQVFETLLKFFGSNRCGNTDSWIHKPCHLKDGSALGAAFEGRLSGGWHDCGDHGKYSETEAYSALVLALTYAVYPEKAEDLFGSSYDDTMPDGIPDLLREAKIGADYILKLYTVSKEQGLVAKNDMYHSVGTGPGADHTYWDVPEKQDAQAATRGGPPRPVTAGIGCNVAGSYAAVLALLSWGWKPFGAAYADSCQRAAIDIYDNIVMKTLGKGTTMPCCYPGAGQLWDDPAMAALALWFTTKEKRFGFDLYENAALYTNPNARYNDGEFASGFLAHVPFHHGGWTTDYEQVNALVLYGLGKLVLRDYATASQYGLSALVRDSLLEDATECLKQSIAIGSNGSNRTTYPGINTDEPYHGVFTSADWGFNRYNMGMVTELFMYWDLTGAQNYFDIGLDNINYNLGMNPWDMSFIMAAGDRNLQHPHNRAANPDGYNAGGFPYQYQSPRGALMGGCKPGKTLKDDWSDYTVTETCIDFSAQIILPTMILAKNLPIDNTGPQFQDITIAQISDSAVSISWRTNELSHDSLSFNSAPVNPVTTIDAGPLSMNKSVTLVHLAPNGTYFFFLKGTDIRGNTARDDNYGNWYSFTLVKTPLAQVSAVRVCNISSDQATVYWWTNEPSTSGINYGTATALGRSVTGDDNGTIGRFHSVTLRNLAPNTKYFFDVIAGTTTDNNSGAHYTFSTRGEFYNIDVQIKPTKKGNGTAHFYVLVTNNEATAFAGITLRFYFQMDASQAAQIVARGFDNQIFPASGIPHNATIAYGTPVQTTIAATPYWYIPITVSDTLPVSGMARIELQFNGGSGGWGQVPFSQLNTAWSLVPHSSPVVFPGVNIAKAPLYTGPDFVETISGIPELTYVKDMFIPAYYKNTHIYGYGPDYANDMPATPKTVHLTFSAPVQSPRNSYATDTSSVRFTGTAWALPDGKITNVELNASQLAFSALGGRADSVAIAHTSAPLATGTTVHEWVAWHNKTGDDCACAYQRIAVTFDTNAPPRLIRTIRITPADSIREYAGNRRLIALTMVDSTGTVVSGEDMLLSLASSHARLQMFADANSQVATTTVALVNGRATIAVTGDTALAGTITVTVSSPRQGSVYVPARLRVTIINRPAWPYIVTAAMVDPAGTMVPGRVDAVLSDTFLATVALSSAQIVYEGSTYTIGPASIIRSGTSLQLLLPAGLAPNPTPAGTLTISLIVSGEAKQESGPITDGIGPQIARATLLEKSDPSRTMILVEFTEPVQPQRIRGQTFLGMVAGGPDTLICTVDSVVSRKGSTQFALRAAAGTTQLRVGDRIRLMPGSGGVLDIAGITPHQKNPFIVIAQGPALATRATYFDGNADGYVDTVLISFGRTVIKSSLIASCDWSDIRINSLANAHLSYYKNDSTTIAIKVDSVWTRRELRTSRPMFSTIWFSTFPDEKQSLTVQDSAAPVLLEATYCPAAAPSPDTLLVRFSEAAGFLAINTPINFRSTLDGTRYALSLSFLTEDRTNFTMRFLVLNTPGTFKVSSGDSVWMATGAFSDLVNATVVQKNSDNRRVVLSIKLSAAPIVITLSNNPFMPALQNAPLTISVAYQSAFSTTSTIQASAKIYDALGSCIYEIKEFKTRPQTNGVTGIWPGLNRNGRIVGTGTYVAVVQIRDGATLSMVKKVMIGVKR